jgi:ADP-ribose pyrophosphatase
LLEETGYVAREWKHAATLHAGIGYSNETIQLYVARDLEYRGHQLDEGEFLEVFRLKLGDAVEMVGTGEITDTKSAFSLLWLERFQLTLK